MPALKKGAYDNGITSTRQPSGAPRRAAVAARARAGRDRPARAVPAAGAGPAAGARWPRCRRTRVSVLRVPRGFVRRMRARRPDTTRCCGRSCRWRAELVERPGFGADPLAERAAHARPRAAAQIPWPRAADHAPAPARCIAATASGANSRTPSAHRRGGALAGRAGGDRGRPIDRGADSLRRGSAVARHGDG